MSQNQEPHNQEHQSGNVRHIPIFVEGRDEPVINKNFDHAANYADPKPAYVPPPQPQPHIDREQYFADEPAFHHPPNFSRAFGTPFSKGFRQGPQPFTQQKAYPQAAFARGASPQRSQSPKPSPQEEHFVKVPVHHEQSASNAETPRQQQQQQRQPPVPPQRQTHPPPQQSPPRQEPPNPQPPPQNDPITQILAVQTDVLNLMTDVENFTGTDKKDKHYLYLDEMLTRNLIKLDNIETDGKENIRQARKEAIKCIQKCIGVLEAKAEKNSAQSQAAQDVEMKAENEQEITKEEEQALTEQQTNESNEPEMKENAKEDNVAGGANTENQNPGQPEAADTRPVENASEPKAEEKKEAKEEKKTTKKGTKNVKKRDKSKDKKEGEPNKTENVVENNKTDAMLVDDKGDKNSQAMEVDGASPSQ